ncbi:hypothetical protein FACS1894184_01640 [Clostridia bacterium]|nr:hypothetical protein FACS1894184_01640 [Clostridia bacterium]
MKRVSVIPVFNPTGERVLVCLRTKDPYKGKMNFVGGKTEPGEGSEAGAYRELFEETGITRDDISLTHVMDFTYYVTYSGEPLVLEVYSGTLLHDVTLREEVHPLLWVSVDEDFADNDRFAGDGNMQHMICVIRGTWVMPERATERAI